MLRIFLALSLMYMMAASVTPSQANDLGRAREHAFDIVAQPLSGALLSYSEQARVQLILAVDTSDMPYCAPLKGRMNARDAIAYLLAESGLEFYFSSPNTVTVRRMPSLVRTGDATDRLRSPPQPAN